MTIRQEAIDANFITATDEDQRTPGRMDDLRALAERTGKMLVMSPKKSFAEEHLDAVAAHLKTLPTIKRGDDRAFLDNLDAIACGKAAVI